MILYEKRDRNLQLSKSNTSAWVSRLVGILCTIWGIALIVGILSNKLSLSDPFKGDYYIEFFVCLFAIALIIIGISIFNIGLKKDSAPNSPLFYDPKKLAWKRLINGIIGIIFMTCFSSIFIYIGLKEVIFFIVGSVFFLLPLVGAFFEGRKVKNLFKANKKFGSTELIKLSGSLLRGDTAAFRIVNSKSNFLKENLQIVLRNLAEKRVKRFPDRPVGKKNPRKLKTFILAEAAGNLQSEKNQIEFEVQIPLGQSLATDYNISEPTYWELEITSEPENYLSRFYIEVK